MLSQTAEYALRAVLYLADNAGSTPVSVEVVAGALGLPRNYLAKTLHTLVKAGLLESSRGPRGGFQLAVPPDDLTLFAIVEPFDVLADGRSCLLGRTECDDRNPCPAHARWKSVSEDVAAFFRRTTVGDLVREYGELDRPPGPERGVPDPADGADGGRAASA